ncbi:MAG TPA: protein kinase, partial [Longimicrobium sp.]|nr:protein kinase [Longimicrobium sp.]
MVGLERLLIGRMLGGRYAVEELIGRGRGGLVYRARDTESGAEIALKVLAAPQTAEARERYRRLVAGEVGIAAGIEHPNVVAVHALGVDPELDVDFVTSELARGQTLAAVLAQRGNPPVSLGLRLLSDAADGLAAGHRAGLVHRDLRPASLYLVRSEAER